MQSRSIPAKSKKTCIFVLAEGRAKSNAADKRNSAARRSSHVPKSDWATSAASIVRRDRDP
jgi:hypothetical protein